MLGFFFFRARPWNKACRHVFLTWMVVQRIGKSPGVISGEDWLVKQTLHSATASAVSRGVSVIIHVERPSFRMGQTKSS